MGDLVRKSQIAPFINKGTELNPDWIRIKKSTAFTLALNPNVKTFEFISDDEASEEIDGYKPTLSQDITMFKGEPDYEFFFDMVYSLPKGKKAHRDVLIVFYQEKGTYTDSGEAKTVYKAWKVDSLVKLNQLDSVNSSIGIELGLKNPILGAVYSDEDGKAAFIEGSFEGDTFTKS